MTLQGAYPPATRGTLVVWGLLAHSPFGGMTWQVLHHVAGLRRLGFDVWYVEDSDARVVDPVTYERTFEYEANLEFMVRQIDAIGMSDRWVFRPPGRNDCLGARDRAGLARLYQEADAVFNLCGAHEVRDDHASIRCLVYLETDPVQMQVAVANGDQDTIEVLERHHHLFTYGENIGSDDCTVPIGRLLWHPTRPPVCIDWWQEPESPRNRHLTTVVNWKHSGRDVEWNGEIWRWSKHHEFLRFISMPARSVLPLELALGAATDEDRHLLRSHGWCITPSINLAEPSRYRSYIRGSLGEFSVAKDQYVKPRSGWFSDRTVCYLAAGRPAVVQETGFSSVIPAGEGLFAFSTEDEAADGIAKIASDYPRHSRRASALASEYFDAEKVLRGVLQVVGLM